METKEIWKDIPGYEGLYQVSNKGNVKSLNYRRTGKENILKVRYDKCGYLRTNLTKNKIQISFYVHRLVACVFNNLPLNINLTVNHKDGNKTNNNLENLELCTIEENNKHALRMGLLNPARGSKAGPSKLTEEQVLSIREDIKTGLTHKSIAIKYGVTEGAIASIKTGRTWKHL